MALDLEAEGSQGYAYMGRRWSKLGLVGGDNGLRVEAVVSALTRHSR